MSEELENKEQLISELEELHRRVSELEESEKELKRVREALQCSEAELSAIMDSAPIAMFLVDPERRVRRVNGSVITFTGRPVEEMIGLRSGEALRCLNSLDSPEGCGFGPDCQMCSVRRTVMDTFETGIIHHQVEASLPFASGENTEERHFLVSTTPVNLKESQMVMVSLEDITERKEIEKRLQESERQYRLLAENVSDVIWAMDMEFNLKYVSPSVIKLLGYVPEETLLQSLADILTPASLEVAVEALGEGVKWTQSGTGDLDNIRNIELEMNYKDGSTVWTETTANLLFNKDGVAIGFIGISRDIAGRKRAEEEQRRSEERLMAFTRALPDFAFILDENGRYLEVLSGLDDLLYTESAGIIGQTRHEFLPVDVADLALRAVRRAIETGQVQSIDYRMDVPLGVRLLEARISPMASESNDAKTVTVVVRDISELRRAEEKSRQLLEDMNDGYVVIQEGRVAFTNRRVGEIFGHRQMQDLEKTLADFMTPDDYQTAMEQYNRVIRGEEALPEKRESVMIKKDGTSITIEASIKAIRYEAKPAFSIILRDITDRKRVEEKYRQLLEDMNDGYGVIQDGKYVFANRRLSELFGCDPEQLQGKSIGEFMPTESRQTYMDEYESWVCGDRVYDERNEGELIRGDGTKVVLESSTSPIQYEGRPAISIVCRDITERKQVEEKYRQLLDDMSDGYLVTQDGRYIFANRKFAEMVGYDLEQLIGMPMLQISLPEYHETITDLRERMERGEEAYAELDEVKVMKADGTELVAEVSIKVIQYEGKPAIYAIIRDITERKRMEKILQESEEKLRLIFESVTEGIIITDFNGNIIDMNSSAVHMHGYDSKEDLIGRKADMLMVARDHAQAAEGRNKMRDGGNLGMLRSTFVKKDGSEFPAMLSTALIKDNDGRPAGVVTIVADITEQYKRQQQLMLTDRLASIGQLAAGIAHEINNPLTGVIGISELLLEKDLPESIKEDLQIIVGEAQRAASVVRGLLTFVRSKGNEKMLEDINSVVREVLRLRTYQQTVSNIEVEERYDAGLPLVNISGSQMQQVFMNIIINAEQAVIDTHGKGKITVTTEKAGDVVRISIHDDGFGISPDNMKKLFTPFFTTKEVGKGTGLGLSICHGIVTEHGGRIYAESEPGNGATFIIELPVAVIRG